MAEAAGTTTHNAEAALQRHLEQLQLGTPQQQQLTVAALCGGVAARDPALVDVLVQVVNSAPRAIQQQLATQPGLMKDLAGYLAHRQTTSSNTAGAVQQPPAGGSSVGGSDATRSSSLAAHPTSRNSHAQLEAAAGALAHLLDCCEASVPPPPYQGLAPALHAALQQHLVCLPALSQAIFHHYTSHTVSNQRLLGSVLDAAEQGQAPAAAVLAVLAPTVLQMLEHAEPCHALVLHRVTALLGKGSAAGSAFLAAALQQEGTLFEVPGMVEAACSGLLAACSAADSVLARFTGSSSSSMDPDEQYPCWAALPPAHAVLLQYLWGVVGVALHLATHLQPPLSSRLMGPAGPLVPALAEALSLLLETLNLPGSGSLNRLSLDGLGQRPYHDAAWGALLALSERPEAGALVAAVLQHETGLLHALATSWEQLLGSEEPPEEPVDTAARLAVYLLLSSYVPGEEERQQQEQHMQAAVRLWRSPSFWEGRPDELMELLWLPQGPQLVVDTPGLLEALVLIDGGLLGHELAWDALALLLEAPDFHTWLVQGLCQCEKGSVEFVGWLWAEGGSEHIQALLDVPGMADALTQCSSMGEPTSAVDFILGDALRDEELQEYLAQHPHLLQALVARLPRNKENAGSGSV